jgi:hypothetical protein
LEQYPTEVVVKCFTAGSQINRLQNWLDYFTINLNTPNIKVILLGHSLGGNAIRIGNFSNYNLYSRISIDPIDPDQITRNGIFNQRDLTFPIEHFQGYYFNYLASTEGPIGLLGHHVTEAVPYFEPNTNHTTIVDRIVENKYLLEQVDQCMSEYNYNRINNPLYNIESQALRSKAFGIVSQFSFDDTIGIYRNRK